MHKLFRIEATRKKKVVPCEEDRSQVRGKETREKTREKKRRVVVRIRATKCFKMPVV